MTKLVTTDKIEEGMILASPLVNKYGQMLLPQGVALESRHIFMLKTWGIQTVVIQHDSEEDEDKIHDPELVEKTKEQLKSRMKWAPRNQFEEDMFKMGVKLLLQKQN